MIQIHPLQILQTALTLGYTQQDLYPLTLQQIQRESLMIVKNMNPKEKQFYLQKKLNITEARRNKILQQVYQQTDKLQNQLHNFNQYNPKVKQIIQQHQKSIQKTINYNQVRSRASSRNQSHSNHQLNPNPLNLARASPAVSNRSSMSKSSQASRNINSQVSNRSNRTSSSANSLTRSKLDSVRQKQKQVQQLKKRMLVEKQRQDEIKFLKAEEKMMNKSRKAKIRSQISQKIVKENKEQMEMIKNMAAKDHLQSVKFSIERHNHQRQKKQLLHSISHSQKKDIEVYFVKNTNKRLQKSKQRQKKYRYEEKHKQSLQWQDQYNELKMRSIQFTQNQKYVKQKKAIERRSFQEREEKKFREQVLIFEQKRIDNAQYRRQEEVQLLINERARRKLSGISQQIKRQIVSRNKKSIETSQSMRKHAITKHYHEKIQELSLIDNLKQVFIKARQQLKNDDLQFAKTIDIKPNSTMNSKINPNGPRNSVTSKNNRLSYFNTILH